MLTAVILDLTAAHMISIMLSLHVLQLMHVVMCLLPRLKARVKG